MLAALLPATGAAARPSVLQVPSQYPTIQAAVNAAYAGDTVRVAPGRYHEQVTISKNLRLFGAGRKATTVVAPDPLKPNVGDAAALIGVTGGAKVEIANLGVSGPVAHPCAEQPLHAGIFVAGGATLKLSRARVSDIVNTPVESCDHDGNGILVGSFLTGDVGHAVIDHVEVTHYTGVALTAFSAGTTVTLTDSLLDAKIDPATSVFTGGVEIGDAASAHVTRNVVIGNRCNDFEDACGPDPSVQFQAAAFEDGPGALPAADTEIAHNRFIGNDAGLYLFAFADCCRVHDNVTRDSIFYGAIVQDGDTTLDHEKIVGGPVGVIAVADLADTTATLKGVVIKGAATPTKTQDCCGFTASIVRVPGSAPVSAGAHRARPPGQAGAHAVAVTRRAG